jgi:hypothetical protein
MGYEILLRIRVVTLQRHVHRAGVNVALIEHQSGPEKMGPMELPSGADHSANPLTVNGHGPFTLQRS